LLAGAFVKARLDNKHHLRASPHSSRVLSSSFSILNQTIYFQMGICTTLDKQWIPFLRK